jgi:hypothetical protein
LFKEATAAHPNKTPPHLHPLIVALTIVLDDDDDLSLISASFSGLERHKYYNPQVVFPDLAPYAAKDDCWWEDLGTLTHFLHPFGFHNASPAAQSRPGKTPQEPVAPEGLTTHKVSAAPKNPSTNRQVLRILPPRPPQKPAGDEDVEMGEEPEPVKVSICLFIFSLPFLTVLEDLSAPQEAKGSRRSRPPHTL